MHDIKINLIRVINTLNTVEVKGADNMDALLASINTLKKSVVDLDKMIAAAQAAPAADAAAAEE